MPWNSLFVLAGSKFRLRIPFGKPHTARVADSLWAGVCGANVLTLCFPSPSAFFKREKTEFFREFSNAENSLFFCHFVVFSSEKYNFILCRLFHLYFRCWPLLKTLKSKHCRSLQTQYRPPASSSAGCVFQMNDYVSYLIPPSCMIWQSKKQALLIHTVCPCRYFCSFAEHNTLFI